MSLIDEIAFDFGMSRCHECQRTIPCEGHCQHEGRAYSNIVERVKP